MKTVKPIFVLCCDCGEEYEIEKYHLDQQRYYYKSSLPCPKCKSQQVTIPEYQYDDDDNSDNLYESKRDKED